MQDIIELTLPCKKQYVTVARLTTSSVASNMNFNIESIEDLKVAVSEACNNVILHSATEDYFDIKYYVDAEELKVVVKDLGKGFDISNYEKPDLDNPQEGGLGIYIIKTLMDQVEIVTKEGNGTTIEMIKYIE